ncbi:MAG: hypothetical protein MUP30_06735, partial [Deltaproteobacteria bacterium]|nr:hypothetical protein [Deltaproteobacteria bacterium]
MDLAPHPDPPVKGQSKNEVSGWIVSGDKQGYKILMQAGSILASVHINFIGAWRLVLGVRAVTADVNTIDEAKAYIETQYGPVYQKKFRSRGVNKKQSIWESSNILLNGRSIKQLGEPVL